MPTDITHSNTLCLNVGHLLSAELNAFVLFIAMKRKYRSLNEMEYILYIFELNYLGTNSVPMEHIYNTYTIITYLRINLVGIKFETVNVI